MRRPFSTGACALTLLVLASLFTGCVHSPHRRVAEPTAPYPRDAAEGPAFDIVVTRDKGRITLVNRSPRSYDGYDLWLNAHYVAPAGPIAIGSDNTRPLSAFINGFGEAYPTGTFLRPERSARLVLAELYDPRNNLRHKLVVQPPGTR